MITQEMFRAMLRDFTETQLKPFIREEIARQIQQALERGATRFLEERVEGAVVRALSGQRRLKMDVSGLLTQAATAAAEKKPEFNADKTRYIAPALLGWTCYGGEVRDGDFRGVRMGVLQDDERARLWLHDTRTWEPHEFDDGGEA